MLKLPPKNKTEDLKYRVLRLDKNRNQIVFLYFAYFFPTCSSLIKRVIICQLKNPALPEKLGFLSKIKAKAIQNKKTKKPIPNKSQLNKIASSKR